MSFCLAYNVPSIAVRCGIEVQKLKLLEQLATEENDLKVLALGKQLIREERNQRFEETWLPKLQEKCNVKHDAQMGRYTFELNGYGVIS